MKVEEEFLFSMNGIESAGEDVADGVSKACIAGQVAEIAFALEATKRGFMTYFPTGHSTKIDVVVGSHRSKLIGVQVKKGSIVSGGWYVNLCHVMPKKNNGRVVTRKRSYTVNDFDVMAVYLQERDSFVFYRATDMPGTKGALVNPCKQRCPENNWEVFESKEWTSPH